MKILGFYMTKIDWERRYMCLESQLRKKLEEIETKSDEIQKKYDLLRSEFDNLGAQYEELEKTYDIIMKELEGYKARHENTKARHRENMRRYRDSKRRAKNTNNVDADVFLNDARNAGYDVEYERDGENCKVLMRDREHPEKVMVFTDIKFAISFIKEKKNERKD